VLVFTFDIDVKGGVKLVCTEFTIKFVEIRLRLTSMPKGEHVGIIMLALMYIGT